MINKLTDSFITHENNKRGSDRWKLDHPATNREIEGYASHTSINKGEHLLLFVNTSSKKFTIEIFRMGWYQGLGGRSISDPIILAGVVQETPLPNSETGLVECQWKHPYKLQTNDDWPTGVYVAKLTESDSNKQSYIIFVVRDDQHSPDILFQLPVTTYQAYNHWGGKSLYDFSSGSSKQWGAITGKRASKVSFNRPYARSNNKKAVHGMGAGEFFTNVQPVTTHHLPISSASWDYNMVRWLEKNGYDVGYITNIDTHRDYRLLDRAKVFMSHGHDEYWSAEMRANVKKTLENGSHLTFFSSNTMFWQIRLEASILSGQPYRTIVCHKDVTSDSVANNLSTVNFRDEPVNNPESKLIGVQHFMDPVDGDIIISNASHWLFQGLEIEDGHKLKGLLGYEIDGITNHSPKNITVLATSPGKNLLENNLTYVMRIMFKRISRKCKGILIHKLKLSERSANATLNFALLFILICVVGAISVMDKSGSILLFIILVPLGIGIIFWFLKNMKEINKRIVKHGNSHMTLYETEGGAKVFATGSMQWCWGLDDYNVPELRSSRKTKEAEIITHNILRAFGASESSS